MHSGRFIKESLCLLAVLGFSSVALSQDPASAGLQELTPTQLEQFNFELDYSDLEVSDLSLGQRYVLNQQRREMKDMIARHLGIIEFENNRESIRLLQQMVDRDVIPQNEVRDWQSLGIVFGDILAQEFGLKWVSYEDNLGVSKVLRWRATDNFIFPVTLFSKRVQYGDPVNVQQVFNKLEGEIEQFKAYESERLEFKPQ